MHSSRRLTPTTKYSRAAPSKRSASKNLHGAFVACAATADATVQHQVATDARSAGVLLNVVDRPHLCDFIMPAVVERGDLVIATSTGGASPALARRIRQELEDTFGPEYAFVVQLLRRLRDQLAQRSYSSVERQRVFSELVHSPLLEYVRQRQATAVDRLLATTIDDSISLAALGLELS